MAARQPSCYLTRLPVELQLLISDYLRLFEKHHLGLTSRHFHHILASYQRIEVLRSVGTYSHERGQQHKVCENCTVAKHYKEFPANNRYHYNHLQESKETQRAMSKSEFYAYKQTIEKLFRLKARATSKRYTICLECGTGQGGKPALWPLGIWGHFSPWDNEMHVYCTKCFKLEQLGHLAVRFKEEQTHLTWCWECVDTLIEKQQGQKQGQRQEQKQRAGRRSQNVTGQAMEQEGWYRKGHSRKSDATI